MTDKAVRSRIRADWCDAAPSETRCDDVTADVAATDVATTDTVSPVTIDEDEFVS